jgi:hypothetical protein
MWLIGTLMNCSDGSMAQEQHRDVTDTLGRTRHHPRSQPHRRRAIHRTFDDAPPIVILPTK